MKTHTIKTPTAELLIVELPENGYYEEYRDGIEVRDFLTNEVLTLADYTLLGKPDEISEEDAEDLVEIFDLSYYVNYNHPTRGAYTLTAKESLLSLLESEIYWENPLANEIHAPDIEEWREAEQKTFDRQRSLIFNKKI